MSKTVSEHGQRSGLGFMIDAPALAKVSEAVQSFAAKEGNQRYIRIESDGSGIAFYAGMPYIQTVRTAGQGDACGTALRYTIPAGEDGIELSSPGAVAVLAEELNAIRKAIPSKGRVCVYCYSATKDELEKYISAGENDADQHPIGKIIVFLPSGDKDASESSPDYFVMPVCNPDTIPRPDMSPSGNPFKVKAGILDDVVGTAASVAESTSSAHYLCFKAIELKFGLGAIQAMGSQNSVMMSVCKVGVEEINDKFNPVALYLMGKAFSGAVSMLDKETDVEVSANDKKVVLVSGRFTFVFFGIIEKGTIEKYRCLQGIVANPGDTVETTIDKDTLLEALDSASMGGYLEIVELGLSPGSDSLSIACRGDGRTAKGRKTITLPQPFPEDAAEINIEFNVRNVKSALSPLPKESVRMFLRGDTKAVIIRSDADNVSYIALVQPRIKKD
jgi:DNA polymerase III sliding clamp (beta) subunit (PCNA family)